eukprot:3497865-Pyramimonas_sp.AAC.1
MASVCHQAYTAMGWPTPSHAPTLERDRIKLLVRPPALARTSDVAGHIGHIVEDHLVTEMRAFSDVHQTDRFRRKLRTWKTSRG